MIKVVSFKICPFVQRVTAALEAKKVPYEIEYISLKDKPQWFLDVSPNGQVPLLISEQGTALFESDAIIEYIEDEYGATEPEVSNVQRALDRAWSYLGAKNYLSQCSTMRSKDEQTFMERQQNLLSAFKKVEKQLTGKSKFFKSDALSNIDFAWLPLLHRAHIIKQHTGFDFFCGLPKVQAWQAALMATGLAEKTVSDDFETLFTGFYLSDTYLANDASTGKATQCIDVGCC